jgi:regulator of replication initiation timing
MEELIEFYSAQVNALQKKVEELRNENAELKFELLKKQL